MTFDKHILSLLYPIPKPTGDSFAPSFFPGHSLESADALVKLLKENQEKHHIFFNDKGFHNHLTHHILTNYSLGASASNLQAAFSYQAVSQRPSFASPGTVTESTWLEHLGDEKYYCAYYDFFAEKVLKDGMAVTIENYVFDPKSNWVEGNDKGLQPQMLNRIFSGVIHSFIHIGYALEFNCPGMLVEGLSMACVTRSTDFDALVPRTLFTCDHSKSIEEIAKSMKLDDKNPGKHSFEIISRMLSDPDLGPKVACDPVPVGNIGRIQRVGALPTSQVLERQGEKIRKYASKWSVDASDNEQLKSRIDEISMLVTILYGVAGFQEDKPFKADFYLMHLVTSSLFLPSYANYLKSSSLSTLLRTYFSIALTVWVARGRPAPSIEAFYARSRPQFSFHGPSPTPGPDVLIGGDDAIMPNPWMYALQSSLVHPDEHLAKCMRALAHFAALRGAAPAGTWAGNGLQGDEKIDGTIFIRVASLTMDYLGWVREGAEKKGVFDFTGFWD